MWRMPVGIYFNTSIVDLGWESGSLREVNHGMRHGESE